jgi:hypothetical protein
VIEPIEPPWWLTKFPNRSRVIEARSQRIVHGAAIDPAPLREMLDHSIRALTGERTADSGWRAVLGNAQRIVLKFNSVGADVIDTTDSVARQLLKQIIRAGYSASRIVVVEAPTMLRYEFGTAEVPSGWGAPIRLGPNYEDLAGYLLDCDALINIGFLKTHQIAGMSCCMKNLSHALIRHPARYHSNGCSPYVPQIISQPPVSSRMRLNIVDALRPVIKNGPDANEDDIESYGGLLMGFDPLAVDWIARSLLEIQRRRHGLDGLRVPYLRDAALMGAGRAHPAEIERVPVRLAE